MEPRILPRHHIRQQQPRVSIPELTMKTTEALESSFGCLQESSANSNDDSHVAISMMEDQLTLVKVDSTHTGQVPQNSRQRLISTVLISAPGS